jgi:DNA-binding MarR family transcriptional regulator
MADGITLVCMPAGTGTSNPDVEALMRASRVITAAIAHSLAVANEKVTLPQLRVLVLVEDRGTMNLSAVADALGVNPSNASRTCDRLVAAGLLDRREDPADRRNLALTVTRQGRRLVDKMMGQRRAILGQVAERMSQDEREAVALAMDAFTAAAKDLDEEGHALSDGNGHLLRWLL